MKLVCNISTVILSASKYRRSTKEQQTKELDIAKWIGQDYLFERFKMKTLF